MSLPEASVRSCTIVRRTLSRWERGEGYRSGAMSELNAA